MGIALIVPDISFAGANLGKVTLTGSVPVTGIAISGPNSAIGAADAATFVPSFTPANTTQRGVQWSVVSGSTYASINASTGALTILPGASGASVTIRVTSLSDNTIFAEKTISVTYSGSGFLPLEDATARFYFARNAWFVTDIVLADGDYLKVKFAQNADSGVNAGTIVGSRKLSDSDENSNIVEINTWQLNYQGVKSKLGGRYFYTPQAATRMEAYTVTAKRTSLVTDPSLGTSVEGASYTYSAAVPLAVGAMLLADNSAIESFIGDIYGVEVYGSDDSLKHRLIPQQDLTLLDEVTNVTYSKSGTGTITYADN